MPLIPDRVLDDIQSRVDLAEVIGRYVPLKRAGRHFKALCPFHKERTPSFHVNVDKQIFHCFGCGVGGNVFTFLMQQERVTFPEAARQLAQQAGVEIPNEMASSSRGETEPLFEVLEKACRFYERLLAHPKQGAEARRYLRSRGVTTKARDAFRLGVSPSGWDGLWRAAQRSRTPEAWLERAGLILSGAHGARDRFRQRLIFPIQDLRGRIVGFGGRSLGEQEPKYLNSPETPVYSKGRQLFGLKQAKEAISAKQLAVVVEGYFDCVILWQAGIEHVVSPLGTAFTPEQARVLRRYAEQVVLAFDADTAGEAATLRGIDVLVEAGLQVRVAQLPSKIDPDEYVQAQGVEAMHTLLDAAPGMLEWLLQCAAARFSLRTADDRVRAAQFILPTVAKIPNAMLRAEYVRLIAERLRLDEAAVRDELAKVKPRTFAAETPAPPPRLRLRLQRPDEMLTALLIDDPSRWESVNTEAFLDAIPDERLRRIVSMVQQERERTPEPITAVQLISRLAGDELGPVVSELAQLAQAMPNKDEAFRGCVARLRLDARHRQRESLVAQVQTAHREGRDEDVTRLLTTIQTLSRGG